MFLSLSPIGEWLRCDDHVIEQTTFETVKTSDAYILVYSRCAATTSISTNPSGEERSKKRHIIIDYFIDTSVANQLRKRKRAISVDNLNEQKDDDIISDETNEMST